MMLAAVELSTKPNSGRCPLLSLLQQKKNSFVEQRDLAMLSG